MAGRRTAGEGRTDIIEESITALGHLYGEIKGAQTAVQLNDGHYVNKKTTERAADQRSLEVNLLNQGTVHRPLRLGPTARLRRTEITNFHLILLNENSKKHCRRKRPNTETEKYISGWSEYPIRVCGLTR